MAGQGNPQGSWEQFLTADGKGLRWEDVVMAGMSHGSTTVARFAVHQKVDRVVLFSGPRDQLENWYSLPLGNAVESVLRVHSRARWGVGPATIIAALGNCSA